MKKKIPFISWIGTLVTFVLTNLIALFCGTLTVGTFRYGKCYGTGCYGAGNGTGAGYYRSNLSLFGGMGIDDDFLALSIIFFILLASVLALFLVELIRYAVKKNVAPLKFKLPALIAISVIILTFSIYMAIESSYHSAAGGDVIAGFSFLLFFIEGGLIALEILRKKLLGKDEVVTPIEIEE